ncbi:hypothetical protein ACPCTO_13500 [Streptomyces olivoreticuli]
MAATIVAVLGTLAGAVVAGLMQHLTAARTARAALAESRRQALAAAVPGLLTALVDHRAQQYLKVVARREGIREDLQARRARYATRSAVTSALDTLHMVTQDQVLLEVANEAVDASFAIGDTEESALDAAGLRARQAHTALRLAGAARIYT